MTPAEEVRAHAPGAPVDVQDRAAAFLAVLRVAADANGITHGDLASVCSPVAIAVDAAGMASWREKRHAQKAAGVAS